MWSSSDRMVVSPKIFVEPLGSDLRDSTTLCPFPCLTLFLLSGAVLGAETIPIHEASEEGLISVEVSGMGGATGDPIKVLVRKRVQEKFHWEPFPCDDGYPHLAPVGPFKPNAFGLYDMLGNASEWVEDYAIVFKPGCRYGAAAPASTQ
jgi:Sulfatase-modifying factor enzyme 1